MPIAVKICGLTDPAGVEAAIAGGARWVGFVFHGKSPRNVSLPIAAELARMVPTGTRIVGLFVDPSDLRIDEVLSQVMLDTLQLHGSESPERAAALQRRFGLSTIKAIPVADEADLAEARAYDGAVDHLLFDARPPANVASLPGGNGLSFDWPLLAGKRFASPWLLAGGLNADNLPAAVAQSGALAVDVSSGVEDRPGHKCPQRIARFLGAAQALPPA